MPSKSSKRKAAAAKKSLNKTAYAKKDGDLKQAADMKKSTAASAAEATVAAAGTAAASGHFPDSLNAGKATADTAAVHKKKAPAAVALAHTVAVAAARVADTVDFGDMPALGAGPSLRGGSAAVAAVPALPARSAAGEAVQPKRVGVAAAPPVRSWASLAAAKAPAAPLSAR